MRVFIRAALASILVLSACTLIPAASPSVQPAAQSPIGTYATVEVAYRTILERHVDKPSSRSLLDGGLIELKRTVPVLASRSRDDPTFTGDVDKDLDAFKVYLDRAVLQSGKPSAEVERTAVVGMARSLDDCHTYYVEPDRAKNFIPSEGERYSGIGATISQPSPNTDRLPEVTAIFPDSPAQKVGLKAGDRIRKVDDRDVAGFTAEAVAGIIRGPAGTEVRLLIVRPSGEQTFTITRANLRAPMVFESRAEEFGVVTLLQLGAPVPTELAAALGRLDQAGVRGWVLDLRGNGGGDLGVAQLVASTFVRDGVVVYEMGRDGQERALNVNPKAYFQKQRPLAVLVNKGSASGAEIIAATIQEHGTGRIFGETTSGCFSSGQVRELPDGGIILVKITRMRSGVGRQDLTGKGVTPDERVASSPDDAGDKVLAAAIAWLRTQARP